VKIYCTKNLGNLVPADDMAVAAFAKIKTGSMVQVEVKRIRNEAFFKKWWLLAQFAYDHWEPSSIDVRGQKPEKNFERFRKDLITLSGFYHIDHSLCKETFRVEADSIAWSSMDEDTFDILYNKTIDVILKKILTTYKREDIDNVMDQLLLGFG